MTGLAEPLEQIDGTRVLSHGRKLVYFGGCDYFRLSRHPEVLAALRDGLKRLGLNVAASRMTTGNHPIYGRLEAELAGFFDAPRAVLFSNGYITAQAVAQSLAGEFTHLLIDEQAHAGLKDATLFARARVLTFRHRDPGDLARIVRRLGPEARVILFTDGLFAQSGTVAPVRQYRDVLPRNAWILVDDAHAAGVLGGNGRGTPEFAGIGRERLIQTITLSKAFGLYGGAVLCDRQTARRILAGSRFFVGNTPLPLPFVHAAGVALRLLNPGSTLRKQLHERTALIKSSLRDSGIPHMDSPGPTLSLGGLSPRERARLSIRLLEAGIFPSYIHYPGGPGAGYFRFAWATAHSLQQVETLAGVLSEFWSSRAAVKHP
jgi:7-keto-8-aminopelargonate synthetase-like enzyme